MLPYLQYRRIGRQINSQLRSDPYAKDLEKYDSSADSGSSSTSSSSNKKAPVSLPGIYVHDDPTHGTVFVVDGEGDKDPMDAHNWGMGIRITSSLIVSLIAALVAFSSAIDCEASAQITAEFGVSKLVESLATSTYLFGYAAGSLVTGPFSETVGRSPVYAISMILYTLSSMATALSPNLGAQLTFRFFAGFFGSTPLVCAGGSLTDLWSPKENIYVFPVFAVFSFIGNGVGPPIGGYLGQYGPSWRWVDWVTTILAGVLLLAVIFFLPETFKPMLWKWKAQHLRKITGDERYKAPSEIEKGTSLPRQLFESLYRPFFLTIYEPIIMLIALYLTITYVILFTSLNGYTFMFSDTYGFDQGKTGLCFLSMMVGNFLALLLVPLLDHLYTRDLCKVQERAQVSQDSNRDEGYEHAENQQVKNIVPPPESQLYASMFGAPFIPISLFWMAYTTRPDISPWSAIIGSVPFGFGFVLVFVSCYEYLMDSYAIYAASALASASCIRYLAAGGMMPVSFPLYSNLGVQWTLTLLGGLSTLMVPVPYVFYKWGHVIRRKSRHAAS